MVDSTARSRIAVALATVGDLSAATRAHPDAERRASRLAARRAIRMVAGPANRIELRTRPNRPPLALLHHAGRPPRSLSLSITHRHGRAAAIAATGSARVGIDLERLDAVPAGSERMFLTSSERRHVDVGLSSAVLWMLKEASWKALQLSPIVGFHDLQLDLDEDHELRGVLLGGQRFAASATVASPWAGHALVTVQIPLQS